MNVLSINLCGTGCVFKCKKVSHILQKYGGNFLCVQETKMAAANSFRVKNLWGNYRFDYVESLARGRSGGILSVWDPSAFVKSDSVTHDNFVIVKGVWSISKVECYIINVYAPQAENEKVEVWNKLLSFMQMNKGKYIICGDFNSTRNEDERMGTSFSRLNANNFNDFISKGYLVDLNIGRHKFTRTSNNGLKASRLDRFLLNSTALDDFKYSVVDVLDDVISDHRPLLFYQKFADFGPCPFKFFNSWITLDGLDGVVKEYWGSVKTGNGENAFVTLKNKLRGLKAVIKQWNKVRLNGRNRLTITRELAEVDLEISKPNGDDTLVEKRMNLAHELRELQSRESKDLRQKAKVKWAIEGDENSKFFHAIINAKRKGGRITGVKHNGRWIDQPSGVKSCFRDYFAHKFQRFDGARFKMTHDPVRRISEEDVQNLEVKFSTQEIKEAIWNCGGDKAPGPDGFSFAFIKHFWDVLKDDVVNMVNEFHENAFIPVGCNASFITLIPKVSNPMLVSDFRPISLIGVQYKIIAKLLANRLVKVLDSIISMEQSAFIKGRQILDGPLLINEVMDWYKAKKKKMMLFKIDFAKAYDSLSWDYLMHMMTVMGFGKKWMAWIKTCLVSARSSVLVNGSPTEEFDINRGLRQGDPMAPFLFIIAMEGLHIAIDNLVNNGTFAGIRIGQVSLSHLFYADDVLITGAWDEKNLKVISNAFRFFYCISGLKINFHKSSLIGVGVTGTEVTRFASLVGCKAEKLPFQYLGIPIGGSAKRLSFWDPIINKFNKRLAGWKANLLSIGGRTTLIKAVLGALGIYFFSLFPVPKSVIKSLEAIRAKFFWGGNKDARKIHWCKWSSVVAKMEDGGLGIGSLSAMNLSLLYKWRWRGINGTNSLWARIISEIHGDNCFSDMAAKNKGNWYYMVNLFRKCHAEFDIPNNVITRKIGNGHNVYFWSERWHGDEPFKDLFPRLYALETEKHCRVSNRFVLNNWEWKWRRVIRDGHEHNQLQELLRILPRQLDNEPDKWQWCFQGSNSFSSAIIRKHIDQFVCETARSTGWNNLVPKKVNVFVWRLCRNILPTFINLFGRGVDVDTFNCKLCTHGIDDGIHLFHQCKFTRELRKHLSGWLQINIPEMEPKGIIEWYKDLQVSNHRRKIIEVIMYAWWWHVWKDRNNMVYNKEKASTAGTLQAIVSLTFLWVSNRDRKNRYEWRDWIICPFTPG